MIIKYAVPSLALNYPCKKVPNHHESVHSYLCTCMRNKYPIMQEWICMKRSTYKSCWRWSVSLFSTCMSLLRHGCQRHSLLNSQTESQMYTFPDQMNWQFVQIFMDSKFQSKLRVLDTDDIKQKTSVQGKSAGCCFMVFSFSLMFYVSVSGTQNKFPNFHHSHPLHPFFTWIYCECKVQNGLFL